MFYLQWSIGTVLDSLIFSKYDPGTMCCRGWGVTSGDAGSVYIFVYGGTSAVSKINTQAWFTCIHNGPRSSSKLPKPIALCVYEEQTHKV